MLKLNNLSKLYIFFLVLLFFQNNALSKSYKTGEIIENQMSFTRNFILPLSEGKWEVIDKYNITYYGFNFKGYAIAKVVNNIVEEYYYIEKASLAGKEQGYIDSVVNNIIFKDPYDGCYERPEYYLVEVMRKGSTHNCLVVGHREINKELNNPDDPNGRALASKIKLWIEKRSYSISPIVFSSYHSYFSRLSAGNWFVITHLKDPRILNSPKLSFLTEETSEFHKANIHRYEEHKKIMERWVSESSKNHQILEKLYKAKPHHLLNLDRYIIDDIGMATNSLVEQIKKLNELFKSGAITEDEFKKAKNKILN